MREEQEFQDWTQEEDDQLRSALGSLRQDVDAASLPDVRFVMKRAGGRRNRAVAGIAASAAAVLGIGWVGYQALDNGVAPAPPASTSTPSTERDGDVDQTPDDPTGEDQTGEDQTGEDPTSEDLTDDSGTDAAPVDAADLVLAESGGPDLGLFVPPSLWASETFTSGAATSAAMGEFETTAMVDCDTDNVFWGAADEGTFGFMGIWADGSAFGTQRVRVLDSAAAAGTYVNDLDAALAVCEADPEATNTDLVVQPLELSGAYRITTTFRDGTESMTDFYYVVQHEGTPTAASTFRLTDWSGDATDAEAVAELERLAGLVIDQ